MSTIKLEVIEAYKVPTEQLKEGDEDKVTIVLQLPKEFQGETDGRLELVVHKSERVTIGEEVTLYL